MEKKKKSKIQQGMLNRYRMIFIIIALFAILIATMLFKTTVVDAPLWNEKAAGTLVSGDSITPKNLAQSGVAFNDLHQQHAQTWKDSCFRRVDSVSEREILYGETRLALAKLQA